MIKSLYIAGKLLAQLDDYKDYFRPWANPFPTWQGVAQVIVADIHDGQLLPELSVEAFNPDWVDRYLFREAKANATNLVPTLYLHTQPTTEKQLESIRTMVKKIRQSVKNYQHDFIRESQIDDIEQRLRLLPFDDTVKYLFTIRLNGRYFGDDEKYRALFLNDRMPYATYWRKSRANNKVCAVSYEPVSEVWGRVNTLGFTVEKPAFSRNGFDGEYSYKMFPVSPDAVKRLEGAKRLILERLARPFFGMKYLIMPRFFDSVPDEQASQFLASFLRSSGTVTASVQSMYAFIDQVELADTHTVTRFVDNEPVYYDIFFYEEKQAQFAIKLQVANILPARFRQIIAVKNSVELSYQGLTGPVSLMQANPEPLRISLASIKDYFAEQVKVKGKDKWLFHSGFFHVVDAIFYNQPLNREQLLRAFMTPIRAAFKGNDASAYLVNRQIRHSFVLLQFFYQLNLFSFSNMKPAMPQSVGLIPETFERQHPDLLAHPLRRAAFYLGCEVELLLAKQKSFYRNQPFRQYLNGLNLDVDQLRKIHLKLTAKIGEYMNTGINDKRHFYPAELARLAELDTHIGPALLLADNSLSKTEISYSFAVGMAMQKAFTIEQIRSNRLKKTVSGPTA
ncbi:TM1802 family CRISPR-associated protein [Spirosoma aerolatum]|uniref:TM1802 family CRISPR-associated protein n=1 Tax=Spirosoma aerolatum TaxID=1211326 RepID=UPI0009AF031E|nr:TM1802 family CRISPR-associated protein [Spirosoma aerolatum]